MLHIRLVVDVLFCLSLFCILYPILLVSLEFSFLIAASNSSNLCLGKIEQIREMCQFLYIYVSLSKYIFRLRYVGKHSFVFWAVLFFNQFHVWFIVFNTTFSNISVISLLVEETGVPGENHWLIVIHCNILENR